MLLTLAEMAYLLYVVVKLICYMAWSWVGLRLWRPGAANVSKAAAFGILRLAIGVVFGLLIFIFAGSIQSEDILWKYIVIYAPVRLVEWLILAVITGRES